LYSAKVLEESGRADEDILGKAVVIDPVVGSDCRYFSPGLQLLSQPKRSLHLA